MNSIEMWLLEKALNEAESPEAKAWVLGQLKKADTASTNKALKVVIEALEGFLAASAA